MKCVLTAGDSAKGLPGRLILTAQSGPDHTQDVIHLRQLKWLTTQPVHWQAIMNHIAALQDEQRIMQEMEAERERRAA